MKNQATEKTVMGMTMNELADKINSGAVEGIEMERTMSDLYILVKKDTKGFINAYAKQYGKTYNIERDLFEEAVDSAFMKALNGFDSSKGHFIARVRHIAKNLFKNILRDSKANKRKSMTEAFSLNVSVSDSEEDSTTFQDQLQDEQVQVETVVQDGETGVVALLHTYAQQGKRQKKESELISVYMGYSNDQERKEALQLYAGDSVSWVSLRKQVSRAKSNFKKYLEEVGGF